MPNEQIPYPAALFREMQRLGWGSIMVLLDGHEGEDLHLEFKCRESGIIDPRLTASDKEMIGRTISGFANVSGGLLVIGIRAYGKKGEPDRATKVEPIARLAEFQANVEKALPRLTDPPVAGL